MPRKLCVICNKPITYQFWVCAECENSYNIVHTPYRDWPDWIKEMVKIDRRQALAEDREIPVGDMRGFPGDGNDDIFDFITRA